MILENKKIGIIYFKILDLLISFISWNFFTYFAIGIFGIIVLLVIQTPLEKPILMLIKATMFQNGNSGTFTLDNANIPGLVMTWSIGISLVIAGLEFILGKRFNRANNLKLVILTIFALNLAGYLKMLTVGITSMLFFVLIFCFTTFGYFIFTKLNQLRNWLTEFSSKIKLPSNI